MCRILARVLAMLSSLLLRWGTVSSANDRARKMPARILGNARMTKIALLLALGALALPQPAAAQPPAAQAPAEFYKGKQIRLVVGTTTGQDYDLWARLIGRHITRHIPGNPTLIVENMPGAGMFSTMSVG